MSIISSERFVAARDEQGWYNISYFVTVFQSVPNDAVDMTRYILLVEIRPVAGVSKREIPLTKSTAAAAECIRRASKIPHGAMADNRFQWAIQFTAKRIPPIMHA